MSLAHAVAQLRHLYVQLLEERVKSQVHAAVGLLGPAIEEIERAQAAAPPSATVTSVVVNGSPFPPAPPSTEERTERRCDALRGMEPWQPTCDLPAGHAGPHRWEGPATGAAAPSPRQEPGGVCWDCQVGGPGAGKCARHADPAPRQEPGLKCGTFDQAPIPPEVRARMDADRAAAEAAPRQEQERAEACPSCHGTLRKFIWTANALAEQENEIARLKAALASSQAEVARLDRERNALQGAYSSMLRQRDEAAAERDAALKRAEGWEEEARTYAQNATFQREQRESAESRAADLDRWQREVAEGLGFLNQPEGQSGYEVADPATIIEAWRTLQREAEEAADLAKRLEEAREVVERLNRAAVSVLDTTLPVPLPSSDGHGWEPLIAKARYVDGLRAEVKESGAWLDSERSKG